MTKLVLIVDDEPNIVLSLEFLMQQAGYDVRIARDGNEALECVVEKTPDLILLDLMIPKRDGYDVCQTLRRSEEWAKIPVIMLTAKGREVEKEKGMAMGANDYITKPFSTAALTQRVKELLGDG